MLTERDKNLIKSGYLHGFVKACKDLEYEDFYEDMHPSEVFESCENWLKEPVDLTGIFTVEMVVSTEAGENK